MTEKGSDELLAEIDPTAPERMAKHLKSEAHWLGIEEDAVARAAPAVIEPGDDFPDPDEIPPGDPPDYDPMPPEVPA